MPWLVPTAHRKHNADLALPPGGSSQSSMAEKHLNYHSCSLLFCSSLPRRCSIDLLPSRKRMPNQKCILLATPRRPFTVNHEDLGKMIDDDAFEMVPLIQFQAGHVNPLDKVALCPLKHGKCGRARHASK